MNAPLCLVTGATGAVGPVLVHHLVDNDCAVRVFSRQSPPAGLFPSSVTSLQGDLLHGAALRQAMSDVEYVFHLAALLHIVNPSPDLHSEYQRVNVEGTRSVVDEALTAGVKRLVIFSTIAVYGYSSSQILTEETVPQPETFYGRTKLEAEEIVLQAKRQDGQALGCALRLAAVYGFRVKGNYRRLFEALARRRFIPIGSGTNRRTLVYDRDVAAAALLVARHSDAAGQIFNVSDGQFHTMNDIIRTICELLGRNPPQFTLPAHVARLFAGLVEDGVRMVGGKSSIGRATIDKYVEDVAVESRRIQILVGFKPKFDLKEGWQEIIQQMRQCGEL